MSEIQSKEVVYNTYKLIMEPYNMREYWMNDRFHIILGNNGTRIHYLDRDKLIYNLNIHGLNYELFD